MPMREQIRIGALVDDAMRFIADNRERLIQACDRATDVGKEGENA